MKEELMKNGKNSYVDIFRLFLNKDEKIIKSYFVKDNLHLSKKGYEVWKKSILKVFQKNNF